MAEAGALVPAALNCARCRWWWSAWCVLKTL